MVTNEAGLPPPPAPPPPPGVEPHDTRPASPQAGARIADRYVLKSTLGRGGMGTVWAAWDAMLHRDVAIKLMARDQVHAPDLRARFEREAQVAARIKSNHVVDVYDRGVHDGLPYLVLERLDGEDLQHRIKRQGKLSLGEAVAVIHQTTRGLRQAHEVGVIHRDLKPSNLFIARRDGSELLKILDFGVAKAPMPSSEDETRVGVLVGSPPYMGPEQARGIVDLDGRADLWSLAVIAYRALTGEMPYSGDSVGEILRRVISDTPRPPTTLAPELPPSADEFFARAFHRDLEQRFPDARSFGQAFSAAMRGHGVAQRQVEPARTNPANWVTPSGIDSAVDSAASLLRPSGRGPSSGGLAAATPSFPGTGFGMGASLVPPGTATPAPGSLDGVDAQHDRTIVAQRRRAMSMGIGVIAAGLGLGVIASIALVGGESDPSRAPAGQAPLGGEGLRERGASVEADREADAEPREAPATEVPAPAEATASAAPGESPEAPATASAEPPKGDAPQAPPTGPKPATPAQGGPVQKPPTATPPPGITPPSEAPVELY